MKELPLIHLKGFDCGTKSDNRVDEVNMNEMEKEDCCEACYNRIRPTSFEYTPKMEKELWAKSKAWNEEWVQAAIDARSERLGIKFVKSNGGGMAHGLYQMVKNAAKRGMKVHLTTTELSKDDCPVSDKLRYDPRR